jgi:hypothetical protein
MTGAKLILNLLAIFVFFAVVVAGAMLIWQRLPRGAMGAVGEPLCLACGTRARELLADSFLCPACGRDVRDLGLAAGKRRAFAEPFWRLIAFTIVLCIVALVTTSVVLGTASPVFHVSSESIHSGDGKTFQRMDLALSGKQSGAQGPLEGELDADLLSVGGNLVTLEIHSPSLRYEVLDDTGHALVPLSQGSFDESAILRWMTAAKMDTADPQVRGKARAIYHEICRMLKVTPQALPPLEIGSTAGASSGSYSNSEGPPTYLMPPCLMAWSVAWLAGTWLILRVARRKASPADPPVGAAA